MSTDQVRVFRPAERGSVNTTQTSGMQREELISKSGSWVGIVRMQPGAVSGWHHHGDYDSYIYMVAGTARFDFGAGGKESCEAGPGDTCYVPKGVIHREANLGSQEGMAFLTRVGTGEPVINVDGPDS